jgi:hypothetical protein
MLLKGVILQTERNADYASQMIGVVRNVSEMIGMVRIFKIESLVVSWTVESQRDHGETDAKLPV